MKQQQIYMPCKVWINKGKGGERSNYSQTMLNKLADKILSSIPVSMDHYCWRSNAGTMTHQQTSSSETEASIGSSHASGCPLLWHRCICPNPSLFNTEGDEKQVSSIHVVFLMHRAYQSQCRWSSEEEPNVQVTVKICMVDIV